MASSKPNKKEAEVPDLYQILEVTQEATLDVLKKNYNILAKKYHPDRGGDPELFELITQAFGILSNPETRHEYDKMSALKKQSNNDFGRLKVRANDFYDTFDYKPATQDQKLDFKQRMLELNNKRNFDENDQTAIPQEDAKKRYQKMMDERNNMDRVIVHENLFGKGGNWDKNRFNEAWDLAHKKDTDIIPAGGAPAAWNAGGTLTTYSTFENMDQIFDESNGSNYGLDGQNYSDLNYGDTQVRKLTKDDVATLRGAEYVENHSKKDENYFRDMKKRLQERQGETQTYNKMGLTDFNKDDMAGYGILDQVGIKNTEYISFDDEDDVNKKFEKLMKERSKI